MLPRYIQDWILEGEGQRLDFKHSIADCHKIAISLVSFANSVGGTLLIGVDDKGRVVGVDENEEAYMLEIAATKYCKPKVPITLKEHKTFDGKIVMECNINKGSELPYLCRNIKGEWKVYYREDDECKLASIVRYTMMTLQNGVKNSTIFTEKDQEVMELIRGYPEGVNKNVVSRKLKIEYRLTVSILARLMYLGMLKESKKLNTTLYTVV